MRCELLDATLLGNLDLVALEWLLLSLASVLVYLESLVVVGTEESDQRCEIVQSAFCFGKDQLFLVQLHDRVDHCDLLEEVRNLLLLSLKLTVLLIQVVDNPD